MFPLPHPQEWPIANVSGPHLPPSRGRVVYFSTHQLTGESLLHISFLVKVPISKLCCCQGFHVKTRWMQCGVEPSQRESCEMDKAGSPGQQYTRCPLVLRSSCLSKLGLNAAGSLFSMHLHRKYNLFLHACRAKAVHLQCSAVVIQQCKLTLLKGKRSLQFGVKRRKPSTLFFNMLVWEHISCRNLIEFLRMYFHRSAAQKSWKGWVFHFHGRFLQFHGRFVQIHGGSVQIDLLIHEFGQIFHKIGEIFRESGKLIRKCRKPTNLNQN